MAKAEAIEVSKATLRKAKLAPRKARLVIDLVRGRQVETALQILGASPKKGARVVEKLIHSAVANAQEKGGVDVDDLWVTAGWADLEQTLKRFLPRAQGRATPLRKKLSRITVVLGTR